MRRCSVRAERRPFYWFVTIRVGQRDLFRFDADVLEGLGFAVEMLARSSPVGVEWEAWTWVAVVEAAGRLERDGMVVVVAGQKKQIWHWRRGWVDENLLSMEGEERCLRAEVVEEGQEKVAMVEDGDVTSAVEEREDSVAASENGWVVVVVVLRTNGSQAT